MAVILATHLTIILSSTRGSSNSGLMKTSQGLARTSSSNSTNRGGSRAPGGRRTGQLLQAKMARSTPTVLSRTTLVENSSRASSDDQKMRSTGKKRLGRRKKARPLVASRQGLRDSTTSGRSLRRSANRDESSMSNNLKVKTLEIAALIPEETPWRLD